MKRIFSAYCCFFLMLNTCLSKAQFKPADIQLNQEGFYTNAPKFAVPAKPLKREVFFVVSASLNEIVSRCALSGLIQSNNSSIICRIADFYSFRKGGEYVIAIEGTRPSYPFKIADNITSKESSGNRSLFSRQL